MTNQQRFDGYAEAMTGSGIDFHELTHWNCSAWEMAKATVKEALTIGSRPTAFLCLSGMATLGTVLGVREIRMTCPDDVAIIGFDDNPWCQVVVPELSMIKQPARQIGEEAAHLIWQGLTEGLVAADHFMQWELICRGSCGC
jgi:DNA-binding LacI/PurR family transcriptional regulator